LSENSAKRWKCGGVDVTFIKTNHSMNFNKTLTEICSVEFRDNAGIENEYTIYSDGSVIREHYDADGTGPMLDQISVADINEEHRLAIMKTCSKESLQKIRNLFNKY
jgi:hypothetical protein